MHCAHCGKETKGPLFCEYCGTALAAQPALVPKPQKRPALPRWIWIAGGLSVVGILVITVVSAAILSTIHIPSTSTVVFSGQPTSTQVVYQPTLSQNTPRGEESLVVEKYLVTIGQYIDFLSKKNPGYVETYISKNRMNTDDMPAGWVTWTSADSYCTWLGSRLPSQEELLQAGPALNAEYGWEWTLSCLGDNCINLSAVQNGDWGNQARDTYVSNIFFRCVRIGPVSNP